MSQLRLTLYLFYFAYTRSQFVGRSEQDMVRKMKSGNQIAIRGNADFQSYRSGTLLNNSGQTLDCA